MKPPEDSPIIAPSTGRRYSGIEATMEALLPVMGRRVPVACFGRHLSASLPCTRLFRWLRSSNRRYWRIWHARRNLDMLLGVVLRYLLRQKLILLWTSAAQRQHSWWTRFLYHRMDAVVATTNKAAACLDVPAVVNQHGVDTSVYRPPEDRASVREACGLGEAPTIGVFGRVRPQKGTGDLVEALTRVLPAYKDWQVVFIGAVTAEYRSYQKQLETQLSSSGLTDRVRFVGFIEDSDRIPEWYRAVDVVACVSRVEGFGITCLEGMASGCPVLATRAGAWPDVITDGQDGWLADPKSPDDLARALEQALSTPMSELQRMGQEARAKVVEHFSIEKESERLIELYRDLFRQYNETAFAEDHL